MGRDLIDDGSPDPGNLRYYARMTKIREALNSILLPLGGRVSYCGTCVRSITVIWYYGKNQTGWAGGPNPDAVLDDIYRQVFGGL
jgi:hypothetical protein